jgi:hypothetical protein
MAIGNLGAASGAQPAAGPTGANIWLDQGPAAGSAPVGQAGNPAPYGSVTYFNSSFESVMAAVSSGKLSLNQVVAVNSQFGGNNVNALQGNPTLLQAISQGLGQNGTNALNGGPGGGTANSSMSSTGTAPGTFDQNSSMGGTQTIDAKQMVNSGTVSLTSPAQYGGN